MRMREVHNISFEFFVFFSVTVRISFMYSIAQKLFTIFIKSFISVLRKFCIKSISGEYRYSIILVIIICLPLSSIQRSFEEVGVHSLNDKRPQSKPGNFIVYHYMGKCPGNLAKPLRDSVIYCTRDNLDRFVLRSSLFSP